MLDNIKWPKIHVTRVSEVDKTENEEEYVAGKNTAEIFPNQ